MANMTLGDRLRELNRYKQEIENSFGNMIEKQEKLIKMQDELISYMEGYIDYLSEDRD